MNKIFIVLLLLVILPAQFCYAASSIFYRGGVVSLDEPVVKIDSIYGLKLSPLNITVSGSDKEIYFHHIIENMGNTANTISIEVTYVSNAKGWTVDLVRDDNSNGAKDWWENAKVASPVQLGEGGTYDFFIKMTRPEDAKPGDSGSVMIKVSCCNKGAKYYIGFNGVSYGGADQIESTDTAIVK